MGKKRLALLGHGHLNQIIGDAVEKGILEGYELVGVMGKDPEKTKEFAEKYNCTPCTNIEDFMALKPDFVAEALSHQAVLDYGEAIVKGGSNIVLLSTSVLADSDFFEKLEQTASENDSRIYLPGGLVGGFDLLHTASLMNPIEASMTSKKGIDFFEEFNSFGEDLGKTTEIKRAFEGNVKELMEKHPQAYDVAMTTAYVSVGAENLKFNIDLIPDFKGDDYNIHAKGPEVELDLNILTENSNIAAWSVVRILQNAISTVVI